jgi:hypothetical protein
MLLHSFIPERDFNLSQLGPQVECSTWTLPRVKKMVPSITLLNDNAESFLLEQALSEPISTYSDLVQPSFAMPFEMIWIMRPLIYGNSTWFMNSHFITKTWKDIMDSMDDFIDFGSD